jgi:hypothetical protein
LKIDFLQPYKWVTFYYAYNVYKGIAPLRSVGLVPHFHHIDIGTGTVFPIWVEYSPSELAAAGQEQSLPKQSPTTNHIPNAAIEKFEQIRIGIRTT